MENISSYSQHFEDWNSRELSDQLILQDLMQYKKVNENEAKEILSTYKKSKIEKRQTLGFIAAGIGAFLCMLSCILTLIGVLPEMRGLILYGFTSLGITVIVLGLYLIFED
ncbi:MAG: hypothetical protein IPK18_09320 [Sphingobacteriales bacterium]|nr:MAG: hypothetical protein IPK18_09320 [Sphingobacteriales bacterium]